ncbi:MAG: endonuclease/exonuclease/phosphatase family protein [Candidatus Marinimicrobia bacterium]|nr:endonuclease/exonuclease/phosphatase family protein [Candidatus Neomarinimicrobiota bacterium]
MHFRRSVYTILLLTFTLLEARDGLRILSYNIEGMKPGSHFESRLEAIIRELKDLDPDVMGFQEVAQDTSGKNMAYIIADSLSAYSGEDYHVYWQSTHVAYSSYLEGLAIISRLPVVQSGYYDLPPGVFQRKALWSLIDLNGNQLHFFTTHLSYRDEDNELRIKQVQALKSFIETKTSSNNGLFILTGDFNCTPQTDPIAQLADYSSVWTLENPEQPGFTFPATHPEHKIDYIFMDKDAKDRIRAVTLEFDNTYDGINYPSDHFGLMLVLE